MSGEEIHWRKGEKGDGDGSELEKWEFGELKRGRSR